MTNCGIKKYDDLPTRVGSIDVDYLRYRFKELTKKLEAVQRYLDEAVLEEQERGI